MPHLTRIRIAGYKSIRDQVVELGALNVLIGANGAGKSNFIEVFRLPGNILYEELQLAVRQAGGANGLLHFGRKTTREIVLDLQTGSFGYHCSLVPTQDDSLVFGEESVWSCMDSAERRVQSFGGGHKETRIVEASALAHEVLATIRSWKIYHFHDTSDSARVKLTGDLGDNRFLRSDAGNLAAFLYRLRETDHDAYRNVVDAIRMVVPFFDDFDLHPDRLNADKIRLEWREKGSDAYFNANALSDGTLRFISLATLLLQPELPATVLLDEPELGLHPYAIVVLAELLRSVAERTQVVVSTQSVTLVNQFAPADLVIVDRIGGESVFRRPQAEEIESWLDDYALGDLWEKNVLGGRPGR